MIRRVGYEDLEALRFWRNNPGLYQYFNQSREISQGEQINWFNTLTPAFHPFVVYEGGRRVGYTALRDINNVTRSAEFSIYIAPNEQGKGYGRKALKDIVDYGFGTLNLNRIYASVFSFNKAMKLYTDFGFKKDGTLREACYKKGRYWDVYFISLLRGEWKNEISDSEQQVI